MQSHPTRGWSGLLHATAEVCRLRFFRKPEPTLFESQQHQSIPGLSFSSASCPIISIETTLSLEQINTLCLSLKSWPSTNISILWSLLPVLQLCIYERAKRGSLLALKFLACYHFEAFKIGLCGLYFLHIIFTEGCIIISKTRQILMT